MSKPLLLALTVLCSLNSLTQIFASTTEINTIVVVGTQYGDEGKGKFTDILGEKAAAVVRAQGGSNAGHTILVNDVELKLHLIPSGIIHPSVQCYIGADCVVNPKSFFEELEDLAAKGIEYQNRLWISPFAQVLLPYHILVDSLEEEKKGLDKIGTTGQGIGPCYQDKAARIGIRIIDLLNPERFKKAVSYRLDELNQQLINIYKKDPINKEQLIFEYSLYAERIRPFVNNVEKMLEAHVLNKEFIVIEGAQASLLDNTFGFYPKVTSSFTTPSGILHGTGLSPRSIDHILGVTKAYMTLCGNGVFPTETKDNEQFLDNQEGREVGVTDGKNRRIGWFDAPMTRLGIKLACADSIALTKLDIFDSLDEIKVCTHYRHKDGRIFKDLSELNYNLKDIEPLYKIFPGWKTDITQIKSFEDLPEKAQNYIMELETILNTPIQYISVGPDRAQTITKKTSR
jgi:adenylosuccinate synthase